MRQPRYKFGTCGLRDRICLLAVIENRGVPTGAQGVPPEGRSGKPGLSAHRPSREDVICCRAIWRPPSGHYPSFKSYHQELRKARIPGLRSGPVMEKAWSSPWLP